MKRFWIIACVVAIAAVGAWSYRSGLGPVEALFGLKPQAASTGMPRTADAGGADAADKGGHKGGGRGNGGPPAVKVVAATADRLPMDVQATGFAVAADTTNIAPLQAGLVASIAAKDGQTVKQGDLILHLDDRIARAAVDKDNADIAADQAALAQAEAAFQRAGNLVRQSAQPQQTLDQARAARDSAAAKVDADKATLAADQVALEHMDIRAPFDGRIGDITVSPGAYLSAGVTVTTVTRYDPIWVAYRLPQRYLPDLRHGLAARTAVDVDPAATGGEALSGTLGFYDNQVDQATGTVLVKAEFDNGGGLLWPGQTVNVTTRFRPEGELVVVPTVAVRPGPSGDFVYTVDADKHVHVTPVEVARANGDRSGIAKGLKAGDEVIVEGQSQLTDGQAVNPSQEDAADKVAEATGVQGAQP
ncbi:efflux RND transporter periplasmic adaptor subunit [Rhizobium sp. YJ-22]|uniref:efflux RND transporter periplasmic adaptor subunit n=1 Tax=Rhizobium sp. YJ-22 TaxID=3037556 RepID=UPI0024124339|nr:efflux RND transporter periplasmic adaptor subunit [Rhizobium sp. YJ-22]MDG3576433.1 efflux RND transporter periplasmic adaptor subunit [Rhizobium sp. YJ-22]